MTEQPAAFALGVDVGGTNVRVAAVAADGRVVTQVRGATTRGDLDALVATIAALVDHVELDDAVAAGLPVGFGVAGGADAQGVLQFAPNLDLSGAALGPAVEAALGRRVALGNDASMAAWGEHAVGAAVGVDDVLLLTVGTGVGGGVIVGGQLLLGASGLAAELGHTVMVEGGARCPCGNDGCLEAYASGSALAIGDRPGAAVVADARAGDAGALAHVEAVGTWLGIGMASLVAVLDPSLIVLGGGAGAASFDLLGPAARAALDARLLGRGVRRAPSVVVAELGDDAGVVGAALWAAKELQP